MAEEMRDGDDQVIAALREREEAARAQAGGPYARYYTGPLIAFGTVHARSYGAYTDAGLMSVITAARRASELDTLTHAVVRHRGKQDQIICAFVGGQVREES
ncbi:MAG: hypothetical protein ACRDRJ_15130 [Streptosporangiaceae bacterium]